MKPRHFQIVVVGSGFGGSLIAMIAARLGFETLLLERGNHPRFVIGESTTPLTNLLLGEIAEEYDLGFLRPFCKWGPWQKNYPHIACGLKRGFTFYQHTLGHPFEPDPLRQRQLLVGASPREEVSDTHWYRPEFDQYLVQRAMDVGVTYYDQADLQTVDWSGSPIPLSVNRPDEHLDFTADFLIDATGPRGFLHRSLPLIDRTFPQLPPTQALFTHFTDLAELPSEFGAQHPGVPYPPEDAAVHHVFDGGWVWILKFNNGITSAGVAATDALASKLRLGDGESAWQRLMDLLPSLATIFRSAHAAMPFVYQARLAYQSSQMVSERWAMIPSAAGVIDPLLSTGFPLTLFGIKRLAFHLRNHWAKSSFSSSLQDYAAVTSLELNTTARLVGGLYATMGRFSLFKELSFLYFAAASYSENARRLGKAHLADTFLLSHNVAFASGLKSFCERAVQPLSPEETRLLRSQIRDFIQPYDVIGLTNDSRHPWYPALASDVIDTASKLGVNADDVGRTSLLPEIP